MLFVQFDVDLWQFSDQCYTFPVSHSMLIRQQIDNITGLLRNCTSYTFRIINTQVEGNDHAHIKLLSKRKIICVWHEWIKSNIF